MKRTLICSVAFQTTSCPTDIKLERLLATSLYQLPRGNTCNFGHPRYFLFLFYPSAMKIDTHKLSCIYSTYRYVTAPLGLSVENVFVVDSPTQCLQSNVYTCPMSVLSCHSKLVENQAGYNIVLMFQNKDKRNSTYRALAKLVISFEE